MRCLGRGVIAAEARPQQQLSHPKAACTRNRRKCLFKFQRTCAGNRLRAIRDAQQESQRGPKGEADHETSEQEGRQEARVRHPVAVSKNFGKGAVRFEHIILVGAE